MRLSVAFLGKLADTGISSMSEPMDLLFIQTFCRTVETGNLTAAAKAMHITKSVASRRIRLLEEGLGVKLLSRSTRGVMTTDAGARFYERCLSILSEIEDIKQSVKSESDELVGHLRITAPRSFADSDLEEPFMEFMKRHPALEVEMHLSDERVDVISGGYDVALRITNNLSDTSLIARKLADLRAHVVASPSYLKAHGTPVSPADLANHQCVFYANIAANEQWQFMGPHGVKSIRVGGRITTNSGTMQLAAAKKGLAIATLPRFFLRDALATGSVVPILEDWERPQTHLYALYPERRLLPVKVRLFIDFLSEWFADPEKISSL